MEPIRVQGRTLTSDDLRELRALIAQHPNWHRTALSLHLCQCWDWRNAAGQIKDMAARTLLLKLAKRGLIDLPPPCRRTCRPSAPAPSVVQEAFLSPEPIQDRLDWVQPIRLELADTRPKRQQVQRWLAQFHYRGFHGAVGENVQYLAKDRHGRELAVMVFGAAAWKVADRDRFIGWSPEQRAKHLGSIANQQRFLILPWVRIAQLASHLLVLAAGRLSADWQARYGHPVWLLETFVEQERFASISYRAAGWICLGQTTGRTRQDSQRTLRSSIKTIWVRPLQSDFRKHLSPS